MEGGLVAQYAATGGYLLLLIGVSGAIVLLCWRTIQILAFAASMLVVMFVLYKGLVGQPLVELPHLPDVARAGPLLDLKRLLDTLPTLGNTRSTLMLPAPPPRIIQDDDAGGGGDDAPPPPSRTRPMRQRRTRDAANDGGGGGDDIRDP